MIEFVMDLLKDNIPPTYTYHNVAHTNYVIDKANEIGKQEGCNNGELELLAVAALWHDTGFIHKYAGHEKEGCALVHKYLPGFGYDHATIEKICEMIMATKTPQSPKDRLGAILADADLEYLGTDTVAEKADALFRELHSLNPTLTRHSWLHQQIKFLQGHHYFTSYCKTNKEPVKDKYVKTLIEESTRA